MASLSTAKLTQNKRGLYLRDGTMDRGIASEINRNYGPLHLGEGDRVLDLGAHIGLSVDYALRQGVHTIVGVEAHWPNFRLLRKNVIEPLKFLPLFGAAMPPGYSRPTTRFYISPGKQEAIHSTVSYKGRTFVRVPAYAIDFLFGLFDFNVLKVDIEGAEYGILSSDWELPTFVDRVALELHLGRKEWRVARAPALIRHLERQGFIAVKKPDLNAQRGTNGVWWREWTKPW